MPDHLTCLLRNLYAGQEAAVRTGHGTTDWFQIGKGVCQGCVLSPCLFNFYAKYIMRNTGLEEAQVRIKIAGELSITSDMQMTPLSAIKVVSPAYLKLLIFLPAILIPACASSSPVFLMMYSA